MLTLDKQKDSDEVFTVGDITFIVDKKLWPKIKPLHIDYQVKLRERGFVINFGHTNI